MKKSPDFFMNDSTQLPTSCQTSFCLSASEALMFLQCSWSHNVSDLLKIGAEDVLNISTSKLVVQRESKKEIREMRKLEET